MKAIDRLFQRLAATYGAHWDRLWDGVPIDDVKSAWVHELSGQTRESITWAVENLPERPPNAIQFKALCKQAPIVPAPLLPSPKADPNRVAAELAKLAQFKKHGTQGDWARRIMDKHIAGQRVSYYALREAKQCLSTRENP